MVRVSPDSGRTRRSRLRPRKVGETQDALKPKAFVLLAAPAFSDTEAYKHAQQATSVGC